MARRSCRKRGPSRGGGGERNGALRGHNPCLRSAMRFETIAVHAGGKPDPATGSIAPPIHLSTTFEHGPAAEAPHGYLYIREGSPTETRVEEALAAIEGGSAALVFSSGMA